MRWLLVPLCAASLFALAAALDTPKPPAFSERLIADKYGYAFGVAAADLDGDGDLDLTSCDTTNNALYWFENDGKGNFKRHIIARAPKVQIVFSRRAPVEGALALAWKLAEGRRPQDRIPARTKC